LKKFSFNIKIKIMKSRLFAALAAVLLCVSFNPATAGADGTQVASLNNDSEVYNITYKGSDCPFASFADYSMYVPSHCKKIRGILVLQHGCTMEQFGITKTYDLQYRAFAMKWDLAIVETALHGDCHVWVNPESGSGPLLLKFIHTISVTINHPEIDSAPWLLWGHSGGGCWTLKMLKDYPSRILAAVCYSPAFDPEGDYPASVAKIPVLLRHAGTNDCADCLITSKNAFAALRSIGAPASIAYNKGQNHNFSYLRYMAVPFFESALRQRLPKKGSSKMRDFSRKNLWVGDTVTCNIYKASSYKGDISGMCLFLDETAAAKWQEYVRTGTVADKTAPLPPRNVRVIKSGGKLLVSWEQQSDIESGIECFKIYVNGKLAGRVPDSGAYQTFDLNGDNTIRPTVPPMEFSITLPDAKKVTIGVTCTNNCSLESPAAKVVYKISD
jgi:hypothetical protein